MKRSTKAAGALLAVAIAGGIAAGVEIHPSSSPTKLATASAGSTTTLRHAKAVAVPTTASSATTLPTGLTTSATVAPTTTTTILVHGFVIKHVARPLPTGTVLYTIQPGDTLTSIAAKFDQEGWGKLFVDNWVQSVGNGGIVDPNLIYAGRVIAITNVAGTVTMTMGAPSATTTTTSTP
jgi:nucleoid-associated protein YgaU